MSGDVFGNGMLLSEHIQLVAAFDHRHIFLDPDPDAGARRSPSAQRLFELPRSLLGRLRHHADLQGRRRVPAHRQVDRADAAGARGARHRRRRRRADPERADPRDPARAGRPAVERRHRHLREGVGRDQRRRRRQGQRRRAGQRRPSCAARWSARAATSASRSAAASSSRCGGGLVNTDFIDNSAGVDTSDHEVNIKILLDQVVRDGELTGKQRNELLARDDRRGRRARAARQLRAERGARRARAQAPAMLHVHARYMRKLERDGRLKRRAGGPARRQGDRRAPAGRARA